MNSMRCPLCGKAGLQKMKAAVTVTLTDGRQHRLPAAKHEYCPHCDEHFYAPGTLPTGRGKNSMATLRAVAVQPRGGVNKPVRRTNVAGRGGL